MASAWSRPALAAAGVTSVVFAVLVVAVVGETEPRLAATNSKVVASGAVLVVPPGQQRCEESQFVPDEAATLRVYAGSASKATGEPLRLSVAAGSGEVVDRREVEGGYPLGPVEVPVETPELAGAEVCIENLGESPVSFAGNRTRLGAEVRPHADRGKERVRIDFLRPGEESRWALAPTVARRFSIFKPPFLGPWSLWAVLTLAGAAAVAAILLTVRSPAPSPGPQEHG